jgi:hypothetical protein
MRRRLLEIQSLLEKAQDRVFELVDEVGDEEGGFAIAVGALLSTVTAALETVADLEEEL